MKRAFDRLKNHLTSMAAVALVAAALVISNMPATAQTAPAATADVREAIKMPLEDREFVLGQMRGFLEAMQRVMDAAAAGKLPEAASAARAAGMAHTANTPASVRQALPMAFRMMGRDTHMKFDGIAEIAEKGDAAAVYAAVGGILANCNTCHQTYKLVSP